MKKSVIVIAIVAVVASVSYADNIFDVLSSAVKTTVSGVSKTVSNLNPGKVVSDTVEDTGEATQKAGEATLGAVTNTVGVVDQATGNK